MFSGIVEELGAVKKIQKTGSNTVLEVTAVTTLGDTKIGDSIAVNGTCLTVVKKSANSLSFEVIPETVSSTNIGRLRILDRVNLERSLKVGDRISGHFVTGHIDCLGAIRAKKRIEGNEGFEIAIPPRFSAYCIPKGSISVDGISLTIARKTPVTCIVYIIPHTLKNTTLGFKGPSDTVNVEFDILAKRSQSAF